MTETTKKGWHQDWENNVYSKGKQLNRYPADSVVSFVFQNYGRVDDRSTIRILELGCGAGNNLWFAAREGFSVAGIDGSESAIRYAKKRLREEKLEGDLREGDFTCLPWGDSEFDLVIDRAAITTSKRSAIELALSETQRVLKPSGKLLSVIYSVEHPGKDFGHNLGDNTYDEFTGGYFQGLGTCFFASRTDIDSLYGVRFDVISIKHIISTDAIKDEIPAGGGWIIHAVNSKKQ